ncbi:MAG TPA: metallophosphoesterase [Bacteroidota bacterium]|nr:metallophosphoesterase [Bacteroidota bacterium]
MRKVSFAIFFSIALTVYAAINFYVGLRAWEVLSFHPELRRIVISLIVVLAASFIAGRVLERVRSTRVSTFFVWIGSFWLAVMTYFLLTALAIDIVRLSNFVVPWFPSYMAAHPAQVKDAVAFAVTLVVLAVVSLGHLNAIHPKVKNLELSIPKPGGPSRKLHLVSVSDIHLGTIIGKRRLEKIVAMINNLQPDIVLLPGDVFDEDIGPVIKENLGEILRTIRPRFGVFAVTGNHEYIGGEEAACKYLTDHGIVVLRDSAVRVNDSCTIIGREDISVRQFAGKRRKPLSELMEGVDRRLPVILLDHQPFRLEEAEQNGVDLQLSGHTHHGQLWPFNYISQRIFEVSWGYKKKGATHIYVSCGVGTWGPPVRVGNTPEIVNITLSLG